MSGFTIGKLAAAAEVGIETIRFYERQGLLDPADRRPSGYRQYEEEAVARLQFIRRAKDLGFTLGEIRELLELKLGDSSTAADVKRRTERKIAQIEEKIELLQHMRTALHKLAQACHGRGPIGECPILMAMEGRTRPVRTPKAGGKSPEENHS